MEARTHLEAACLVVEAIWKSMPNEWSTGPIVDRALMMPHNWYVAVPEPPKIYKDESDKYHDYLWRVELRCVSAARCFSALCHEICGRIRICRRL